MLLRVTTIGPRLRTIRRLAEFSGLYPWQWTPAEGEAFIDHLRSGSTPVRLSTVRSYEVSISLFVEFARDPRYGWAQACADRFGEAPQEVFHEGNSVQHRQEYEGDPRCRPLTYDEVQALFDAADDRPAVVAGRGVKGALVAARDAAVLKVIYAFGLRRGETTMLDLVDLRPNRTMPAHGRCGSAMVRFGKASSGSPPKRRTVLLVPEMDWIVDTLEEWLTDLRPRFGPGRHPALWVNERAGRISVRTVNDAFITARKAAGLDRHLDPHCLCHSYVTHLTEFGYPARFVQEQVGHAHGATTSSTWECRTSTATPLLEAAMRERLGKDWEAES